MILQHERMKAILHQTHWQGSCDVQDTHACCQIPYHFVLQEPFPRILCTSTERSVIHILFFFYLLQMNAIVGKTIVDTIEAASHELRAISLEVIQEQCRCLGSSLFNISYG